MRFWAMGRPIFPSPMTPTVVIVRLLPAGPRPSPDPVGRRAERDPHGERALHDAPPEDVEGAQPFGDERVLGGERGGLLLRGRPEHREARARRDARPRGQRAGGDDVAGGLQPEHPFQVGIEGGLAVRGRDPVAGGPADDPELRAEHRRAFDRHRAPPRDLTKTVCTFAPQRQDSGQDVYAVLSPWDTLAAWHDPPPASPGSTAWSSPRSGRLSPACTRTCASASSTVASRRARSCRRWRSPSNSA